MNQKCFLFFLSIWFSFSLKAQNSEDIVKDVVRFTNPEWFQSLAQPGKKKYAPQLTDSVFIEYANKVDRKKIVLQTVEYKGDFKNGLFHGKGRLQIKLYTYPFQKENPGIFSYEGDFENGAANGKAFLNYSWWYTPSEMKPVLVKMNCQADFSNGVLKSGLIRYDHLLNNIPVLTCHYSGGLYLKNLNPVLHGLGIAYISKNSPGSEIAKRSPGIDDGLYAGNFFYGEYTGFAICNYFHSVDKELSNLQLGIVGKGELIHTIATLPVNKDWEYREIPANQTGSEKFNQLFGDFKNVKNGVIYLDKENKYTGGIKDDLPHGIGYIENGNGFIDISFWKSGLRLSIKNVLGRLLADTSMLQAKKIKKKILTDINNKKGNDLIYDADYFGSLNINGNPEGWGILLCTKESGYQGDSTQYNVRGSIIGNFNGTNQLDYSYDKFMSTIKNADETQAFVLAVRQSDLYSYYTFISKSRLFGDIVNYRVSEYYNNQTPTIAAIETESFKEDIQAFQQKKNFENNYISSRKPIEVRKVIISSIADNSYLETTAGEKINLQELTTDKIGYGDFVLYNDVFYEVNRSFMLNDYVPPKIGNQHLSLSEAFKNQKAFVLKGFLLTPRYEFDPERVCAFCQGKAPGKSTYTGVGYTGRYETNVYNNNSGGVNIVSKPITTITSVTVDNKPCKYCKGAESRRRVKVPVTRN